MSNTGLTSYRPVFLSVTLLAMLVETSIAQPPASPDSPTFLPGTGTYGRKISTESELAQKFFDQGLRLTYGYYFPEAISSFQQAQQHDSEHPMIYWGMALAMGPNPNSRFLGFRDDPYGEGRKAIAAARARIAHASPAERALIDALYVRFDVETYPDGVERCEVHRSHAKGSR